MMVPMVPLVSPVIALPRFWSYGYSSFGMNTPFGGFGYRSMSYYSGFTPSWGTGRVYVPGYMIGLGGGYGGGFYGGGYFGGGYGGSYYGGGYYGGGGYQPSVAAVGSQAIAAAQHEASVSASLTPSGDVRQPFSVVAVQQGEPLPLDAVRRPPAPVDPAQIASGEALNTLLREIVSAESKGGKGPSAYIPMTLFSSVRFAGSPEADLMNFVRQDQLELPAAFDAPALAPAGSNLVKEFGSIAELVRTGKGPDAVRLSPLEVAFVALEKDAADALKNLPAEDAAVARQFLTRMSGVLKALKGGAGVGLIDPKWANEGLTGAELVRHMTKHHLQFGPAPRGEVEAYETMYRNLAAYLYALTQPKK
jgi:hypothetical protein